MKTFRQYFTCLAVAALLPLFGTVAAQGMENMEYGSCLPRAKSGMSSEPLMAPVGRSIKESAAPMALLTEDEILRMSTPVATADSKMENSTVMKDFAASRTEGRGQSNWNSARMLDGYLGFHFSDYSSLREHIYFMKVKGAMHDLGRKMKLNP